MNHPRDYYEAKCLAVTATAGRRFGIDHPVGANQLDVILDALGWPAPTHVLDGRRKVKVFSADMRQAFPADLAHQRDALLQRHRRTSGNPYGAVVMGYAVAESKRDAGGFMQPSWMREGRKLTEGIGEVDPRDYRYKLAVASPGHVVFTVDGTEFGEPVLIPVESFR